MGKTRVSAIVGGAGVLARFWTELAASAANIYPHLEKIDRDECLHRLGKPEAKDLIEEIGFMVVQDACMVVEPYKITIDHNKSLEQRIAEANLTIAQNSRKTGPEIVLPPYRPHDSRTRVDVALVSFEIAVPDYLAFSAMRRHGLYPGTIDHLVGLAKARPDVVTNPKNSCLILALGRITSFSWRDHPGEDYTNYGYVRLSKNQNGDLILGHDPSVMDRHAYWCRYIAVQPKQAKKPWE